jgi:hypothetical protein
MAFTRFHDDPSRIWKYAEETSYAGRYHLNVPGQGANMAFQEDPQIRLQLWGANITTNNINLESDLRGLTRNLTHDNIQENDYKLKSVPTESITYDNKTPFVDESRASNPAWMYRDLEQSRWETPFINPQANVEIQFPYNVQTRILEKDHFKTQVPVFNHLGKDETFETFDSTL